MRYAARRSCGTCESSSRSSGRPAPGRSSSSPRAIASAILRSAIWSNISIAYRGAIAAGIESTLQNPILYCDAVRMPRQLVPVVPAIERMAAALELVDRRARVARLDMQRVARLAEREAPGEPAWHGERLLDVQAEVDHGDVGLHVDLRLAIRAHAAEHRPQLF